MAFDLCDLDADFFQREGPARVRALLKEPSRVVLPAADLRLGPPVAPGGQILCVGKNYADHAREFDAEVPQRPLLFSKAAGTLSGPNDPVVLPPGTDQADFEAELGVVIGRTCRNLDPETASEVIAGYTLVNDVTDRREQKAAGQWFAGKSPDTFCPVGPCLLTTDACPPLDRLTLTLDLNGERMQTGSPVDMLFPVPDLLAAITRTMTLRPGDLIATGTPSGVGFARTPPVFLQPGDHVLVTCEPIGCLDHQVSEGAD
jgi:2,4-diketo-3-deoxy-L-fuconate hydrolase